MFSDPRKRTGLAAALLVIVLTLIIAHQIGKLPEDPPLATPWEMFDNLAFCVALGFGFPWPRAGALGILLLIGWMSYRLGVWIGGKVWQASE